jgi:hypothetical protein
MPREKQYNDQISVLFKSEDHAALMKMVMDTGIPLSRIIRKAVKNLLKQHPEYYDTSPNSSS